MTICTNIAARRTFTALAVLLSCLVTASLARGQSLVEQAPSLAMVPEDTAVYSVMLHNRDVFDALANSKAYAKIAAMEDVEPLIAMAQAQWQEVTGDPKMKGIVQALLDGLSEEVFVYIDPSYTRQMKLFQQANVNGSFVDIAAVANDPDGMAQMRGMLDVLADHAGELETPEMVIGMRTKNPESAQGLLSFAKVMIRDQLLVDAPPEIKEKFKEEEIGDVKTASLLLDGSMIPWHDIPMDEISGEPGKYDGLVAKLKSMTVAISIAAKGDYVLLSIGATNEHLAAMGQGKGLMARPEFAKLAELEGKKLRSLSYMSEDAAEQQFQTTMAPLSAMASALPTMLPPDMDDMLRNRITADAKEFTKDFQGQLPAPGAFLTASTFSPRGFDSVTYNWATNPSLDSSQPLTLLEHLGGSPIGYYIARGKRDPRQYELLVKWLKKADGYMTDYMEQEGGEEAEKFLTFRKEIAPLLVRLDTANRDMLLPALKDGQSGFVIDAQMTSTQWLAMMPASQHPLPMIELAAVMGVSDAKLLKQGCGEYFAVAQEIANILHKMDPEQVPETKIPAPKQRDVGSGMVYYYMIPEDWGVDKRIAPNAGVSETVAVLSLSPLHTKRILQKSPTVTSGPLAEYHAKPLAAAVGFNFAAVVDALMPWIEYGMASSQEFGVQEFDEDFEPEPGDDFGDEEFGGGPDMEKVKAYVRTGAEVLKCFRGYSSVKYVEEGVQVTRGEWHFQDLE